MTRSERREEMLAHVSAQEQSGSSRKVYCEEHGLSVQRLIYWSKKKRQSEAMGVKGFMPVEVTTADAMELHYPNGVRLLLPVNTALEQVAACIKLY